MYDHEMYKPHQLIITLKFQGSSTLCSPFLVVGVGGGVIDLHTTLQLPRSSLKHDYSDTEIIVQSLHSTESIPLPISCG